jgi:hypothetical protein
MVQLDPQLSPLRAGLGVQAAAAGQAQPRIGREVFTAFGKAPLQHQKLAAMRQIQINAELAKNWPVINRKTDALPEAEEYSKITDKKHLIDRG